jgi:hypothetical protein
MFQQIKKIVNNRSFGLIFSQLLILVVSVINRSPSGYIISTGDVAQVINWPKAIHDSSYVWSISNSEGYFLGTYSYNIYYRFIYALSQLGHLSLSNQASLYFFIFLTGAFWSFYLATRVFGRKTGFNSELLNIVLSLVYTFNIYTLYNFTSTWGVSPFLFLYLLIPLIFAWSFEYFSEPSLSQIKKTLPLLIILFFLSNIANGNMPYFISLNIFLLVFIILIYALFHKVSLWKYLKFAVLYYLAYFGAVAWSVYPQIQELFRISSNLVSSQAVFDMKSWILWQSAHFPTVFFLVDPVNNYINVKTLTIFSGIIFLTLLILLSQKKKISRFVMMFLAILLVCVFLFNKGIGLINTGVIAALFNNPILGSLRSADKSAVFLPFFLLIIVYGLLANQKKNTIWLISGLMLISLLSVTPFFRGNVQRLYSASHQKGQDYLTSKYSSLVKIPDEYYALANSLNQEKLINRVVSFPYNALNSIGWVNYPKWKQIGTDPTFQLFTKPFIQVVSYATYGTWNWGGYWNNQNTDQTAWIVPFLGLSNSRYLLYHLDVDPTFIAQTKDKIKYLLDQKLISQVTTGEDATLYRISDQFYLPHIYTPKQVVIADKFAADLPEILKNPVPDNRQAIYLTEGNTLAEKLTDLPTHIAKTPTIEYKEINPAKFRIRFHGASGTFPLIMTETYSDSWNLFATSAPASLLKSQTVKNYQTITGNQDDQATEAELNQYLTTGLVTAINNGSNGPAFVSKDIKDTVQNDNLPNGSTAETWFKKPLTSEIKHLPVNGYANSWIINTDEYCTKHSCIKNSDGSMDFEIVAEYSSQKLYLICGLLSLVVLMAGIGFWIFTFRRKG